MNSDDIRHLLHRTGFGVSNSQWQALAPLDFNTAVDLLVDGKSRADLITPPNWVTDKPLWTISQRGWTTEQRRTLRLDKRAKIAELRRWWIEQMLASPTPLQERMTLFWSNHFTTQYSKIYAPMLVFRQHRQLRQHALGRFDHMLQAMLRDPAMLLYLDNDKNRANNVNENLARELMELFTLGEGNYTEKDVKEAARCLTGRTVERSTGDYLFARKRFDRGTKTVLGQRGNHDGDDLAALLLAQPATAERVVRKLWLEFISLEPDESRVASLAAAFRANNYDIARLLKALFKTPAFRENANRGVLIKSPVELFVGLMRPAVDGLSPKALSERVSTLRAAKRLPNLFKQAGQDLFDPPTVEGWPGGLEWIDSRTLLSREQTARNLVVNLGTDSRRTNPYLNLEGPLRADGRRRGSLLAYLNAIDPVTNIPDSYTQQRLLLELIRDPTVHLK
ncbi:MAG: DUF1800 domain-containing protein [Pseudomonadota bacterium]